MLVHPPRPLTSSTYLHSSITSSLLAVPILALCHVVFFTLSCVPPALSILAAAAAFGVLPFRVRPCCSC